MHSTSPAVTIMGWLEEAAKTAFRLSFNALLLLGPLFAIYILGGFLGETVGLFDLPYPLLSMDGDPLFNMFAASVGVLICIATSTLVFLTEFAGYDNRNYEIVILASCVGFGFGAGVIRYTAPTVIDMLVRLL